MKTITNKKGNEGFMISGWNCVYRHESGVALRNTGSVLLPTDKRPAPEISLMVHHVRVHSCGKVQMKLHSLDNNGDMAGLNFDPSTPIFEKLSDATAEAERALGECAAGLVESAPEYFEKQYGTAPDYLNAEGRERFARNKATAEKNLETVLRGELVRRVYRYTDADKFGPE